jgi:hypothetical protein
MCSCVCTSVDQQAIGTEVLTYYLFCGLQSVVVIGRYDNVDIIAGDEVMLRCTYETVRAVVYWTTFFLISARYCSETFLASSGR